MLIILYLCINQTLSMNTIRSQIIALLLLISGIVLLGGGVWGFYSLYAISHRYEHTTGTIRTLQIQKIYRLPESECMLWGLLVASGFICMCGSVVFWKTSKTADKSEG